MVQQRLRVRGSPAVAIVVPEESDGDLGFVDLAVAVVVEALAEFIGVGSDGGVLVVAVAALGGAVEADCGAGGGGVGGLTEAIAVDVFIIDTFDAGALALIVSLTLFFGISLASKPPELDPDIEAVMDI